MGQAEPGGHKCIAVMAPDGTCPPMLAPGQMGSCSTDCSTELPRQVREQGQLPFISESTESIIWACLYLFYESSGDDQRVCRHLHFVSYSFSSTSFQSYEFKNLRKTIQKI